jgi:hypothetical protein
MAVYYGHDKNLELSTRLLLEDFPYTPQHLEGNAKAVSSNRHGILNPSLAQNTIRNTG